MDIPHPAFATSVRFYKRGDERRRDTIMIRQRPITDAERKKWLGAPPTVLPEKDKAWRPCEVLF